MRLLVGQMAPDFAVRDLYNRPVALRDYRGAYLLLSFYRFAVCPVCNIRMWRLAQQAAAYQQRGLNFIACVESNVENAHLYLNGRNYPFPLIPALGGDLYQTYGIESSVLGIAKGMLIHPNIYIEAARRHLGGWNVFRFDGDFGRLPADFLIDPDGRVVLAYYGRDHGDFLKLEDLNLFLWARQPARPGPNPAFNRSSFASAPSVSQSNAGTARPPRHPTQMHGLPTSPRLVPFDSDPADMSGFPSQPQPPHPPRSDWDWEWNADRQHPPRS